jgi:hypothetical protein
MTLINDSTVKSAQEREHESAKNIDEISRDESAHDSIHESAHESAHESTHDSEHENADKIDEIIKDESAHESKKLHEYNQVST